MRPPVSLLSPQQRSEFLERVEAVESLQGPIGGDHLRMVVFPWRTSFESPWVAVSFRAPGQPATVKKVRRFPELNSIPREGLGELLVGEIEVCLRAALPAPELVAKEMVEILEQLQRMEAA